MKIRNVLDVVAAGALLCSTVFAADALDPKMVERGKYLSIVGVCDDCHTPKVLTDQGPVPDESKRLSGHMASEKLAEIPKDVLSGKWGAVGNANFTAWAGPWGVSFAANLTPDLKTGIGSWTEDIFIDALRTGTHLGAGRPILPPMPWPNYAKMTDEDLKCLFAYLKSLKPIENAVPDPIPPPMPSH